MCPDKFYDDFISPYCLECDITCETCNLNGCVTCPANRVLIGKFCACPPEGADRSDLGISMCTNCTLAVTNIIFSNNLNEIWVDFGTKFLIPSSYSEEGADKFLLCAAVL